MTERSERMSEEAPGNRNVNGGSYALSLVSSSFPRFSHSCHFGWLRGSSAIPASAPTSSAALNFGFPVRGMLNSKERDQGIER